MLLEEIYSADWMARVQAMELDSAQIMADTIAADLQPSSVLDVGCGPFGHANALHGHGCEVVAVDGSSHAESFAAAGVRFVRADLNCPLDLERTFDVVLCLEVAEHLPESAADVLCRSLVCHTGRWLVATAAPPGQRGRHHINLQPLPYWVDKLCALGLRHEPKLVSVWQDLWRQKDVMPYFVSNLMIFCRPDHDTCVPY